jgi:iron(III) transport system substrate-binding protein
MKKINGKLSLVMLLVLAMMTSLFVGCGNNKEVTPQATASDVPASSDATKKISGTVMIYTSIYPDIIEMMKPEIKKALPDITVEWFQGGTESVVTKITGEMEAKKVEADLLMVADPSYYLTLKEAGVLEKYDSPERANVSVKDEEGYWTGVRISNMIIAYNTDRVSEADAPKSYEDLLDPKWKGKIAMPSPLLSGSAFVAAGALANKHGWEYFEKLKQNGLVVESGNTAVQTKLLTGEYDAVIILEENMLKIAAKGEPVKVVYPKDGVIMIPSPIAMFNSSTNAEASKKVLDWFLSTEGQQIIVKGWMHSVRKDVASPIGAEPLNSFIDNTMKTDWAQFSKESAQIKETFRSKVID